jgi:hypothetical protein
MTTFATLWLKCTPSTCRGLAEICPEICLTGGGAGAKRVLGPGSWGRRNMPGLNLGLAEGRLILAQKGCPTKEATETKKPRHRPERAGLVEVMAVGVSELREGRTSSAGHQGSGGSVGSRQTWVVIFCGPVSNLHLLRSAARAIIVRERPQSDPRSRRHHLIAHGVHRGRRTAGELEQATPVQSKEGPNMKGPRQSNDRSLTNTRAGC